jgi:hypothetical protein
MISEKHSQAARANGARSRGPVTPKGKSASSRNAMRHGLLAATVVLSNEDAAQFEALFYLLVDRFHPVDDIEMSAIEEMAACYWRLRRAFAMETSLLESGIAAQFTGTPLEQTTAAFCDPNRQRSFELLHRYQTRLQNMYDRALRSLVTLRKLPKQLPNEPRTPSVCTTQSARPTPIPPPAAPAPPDPARPPVEAEEFEPLCPLVSP